MPITRRRFIQSSTALSAAWFLPAASWARVLGANERINLAVVSTNFFQTLGVSPAPGSSDRFMRPTSRRIRRLGLRGSSISTSTRRARSPRNTARGRPARSPKH